MPDKLLKRKKISDIFCRTDSLPNRKTGSCLSAFHSLKKLFSFKGSVQTYIVLRSIKKGKIYRVYVRKRSQGTFPLYFCEFRRIICKKTSGQITTKEKLACYIFFFTSSKLFLLNSVCHFLHNQQVVMNTLS